MKSMFRIAAKRAALASLVTIACAFASTGASAGSADEFRTRTVSARGLDLSTPDGAETLYQRIRSAANAVCREADSGPWAMMVDKSCFNTAVSNAVAQANSPLLSELHNRKVTRLARK